MNDHSYFQFLEILQIMASLWSQGGVNSNHKWKMGQIVVTLSEYLSFKTLTYLYLRRAVYTGKGQMEAMFDFITTDMDSYYEICLRFDLEKRY